MRRTTESPRAAKAAPLPALPGLDALKWRCIGPSRGGRVVASFLEFSMASHWGVFTKTVGEQRTSTVPHLNTFIERSVWQTWADHIGFDSVAFLDGTAAPWPSGAHLGQSLAVLGKAPA